MARITVTHRHGQSFDVRVRGYALISDEPVTLGGEDEGPTPTELMVAGLATCAADEVVKSLSEHGEKLAATEVGADFEWDLKGGRVACIRLTLTLPDGLGAEAGERMLESVLACPARKMLVEPPTIEYEFDAGGVPVLAGRADVRSWPMEPPPDVDSVR
jgi:putative redox protein